MEHIKAFLILFLFFIFININGIQAVKHEYLYISVDNMATYRILQPLELIKNVQIDCNKNRKD